MATLGSIATAVRQAASDKAFEVKVLHEAGIAALHRPDKAVKVVSAFVRWGASRPSASRSRRSTIRTRPR